MSPDPLTTEHSREPQTLGDFIFRNNPITAFRLTDDEFTDL